MSTTSRKQPLMKGASPVATDEKEADLIDAEEKEEIKVEELDIQQQFFYQCRQGNVTEIKSLSSQIDDINAVDRKPSQALGYCSENTALHYAVESGDLAAVKVVYDLEAQVDRVNKLKSTPLHIAASLGYTQIVEYLIEKKANTEAPNKIGNTPLHCAVYAGHKQTVKALLDKVDDPQQALLEPRNGIGLSAVKYTAHDDLKTYLKQFFPPKKSKGDDLMQSNGDYGDHDDHRLLNGNGNGNDVEEEEDDGDEGSADETTTLTGTGNATATEQR